MTMTLPPQAYTRETLVQAFHWLRSQPESIQRLAETPDALVGLYLRAKRGGDITLENSAPVSSEDFRATLKSLAGELQQFSQNGNPSVISSQPVAAKQEAIAKVLSDHTTSGAQSQRVEARNGLNFQDEMDRVKVSWLEVLDPKSLELVKKAQTRFNLSSELEALRLLIVLGVEKAQALFTKEI